MTGDLILSVGNEADQISRLAAQRQLYANAKLIMAIQMVAATSIAIGGAYLQSTFKETEPFVVIAGAGFALVDVLYLEKLKTHFQKLGARVQELFDCTVLELQWRNLKSDKPEVADVLEHAKRICASTAEVATLKDWYPNAVKDLPFRPARIVCQMENCHYDSRVRRNYILFVQVILVLVSVATFLICLIQNKLFVEALAAVVAPLIPAYVIGLREISANQESLERLMRLRNHTEELWQKALSRHTKESELDESSRLIQDEIFEHRMKSPVIFSWIYKALRSSNESSMQISAEQRAAEYKKVFP